MRGDKMKIYFDNSISEDIRPKIEKEVQSFREQFELMEELLYILKDKRTDAIFCECHVNAQSLVELSTVDVPLDPEEQSEYRANRELVEDSNAFNQMRVDAKHGRVFSNIVAEFNEALRFCSYIVHKFLL